MHRTEATNVQKLIRFLLVFVAASSIAVGTATAQEEQPAGNTGPVSVGAGMDISSGYYFRGIIQETEGLIAQPHLEAGISLFESDTGLQSVSATAGLWNSLHSGPTGSDGPGDPAMWYESDFYASLGLGFADAWSADVTYTGYTSPNGTFGTVKELAFGLSYDGLGISPYVTLAKELDGQADGGFNEGTYLELGAGPGVDIPDSSVSISFPIALGLSVSDYYETPGASDTFGFFQFGAIASVPLPLPAEFGEWAVSGGVNFLSFGDALQTINGSDQFEPIGVFGISLGY